MRRPERRSLWICHHDSFTGDSLATIQYVAGEDPGVPRHDSVRPLSVDPDGMQVSV
jgi:hypothetical protein